MIALATTFPARITTAVRAVTAIPTTTGFNVLAGTPIDAPTDAPNDATAYASTHARIDCRADAPADVLTDARADAAAYSPIDTVLKDQRFTGQHTNRLQVQPISRRLT